MYFILEVKTLTQCRLSEPRQGEEGVCKGEKVSLKEKKVSAQRVRTWLQKEGHPYGRADWHGVSEDEWAEDGVQMGWVAWCRESKP